MKILLVLAAFVATTQAAPCDLAVVSQYINTDFLDQCVQSTDYDMSVAPPADEMLTKMCRSYGCWMLQKDIDRLQTQEKCDLGENVNIAPVSSPSLTINGIPTDAGDLNDLGHIGETFSNFAGTCNDLGQPRCSGTVDTTVTKLLTGGGAILEASCAHYAGFSFARSTAPPSESIRVKLCNSLDCQRIVGRIRTAGVPACYTLYGQGILDKTMQTIRQDCSVADDSIPIPHIP